MKKKLIFSIPTWNRAKYLENCVDSIFFAGKKSNISISVVISNNASTDETEEVISRLKNKYTSSIISKTQTHHLRWYENLFASYELALSCDFDFCWSIGDDDHILPESIRTLETILNTKNNFKGIIYAGCASRCYNSSKWVEMPLWNASNHFGFHEITGWMSSSIFSNYSLKKMLDVEERNTIYKKSAYCHSHTILHACINDNIIVIDSPMVDTQDDEQTLESQKRWAKGNTDLPGEIRIGDQYYEVPVVTKYQIDNGILPGKVGNHFFRYNTYQLWDRLINEQIQAFLDNHSMNLEKWSKIEIFYHCLENYLMQKLVIANICDVERFIVNSIDLKDNLINLAKIGSKETYTGNQMLNLSQKDSALGNIL